VSKYAYALVMPGSYIIAGARTPIGKMSGALASFSAADLGGFAIAAALQRAGVAPHEVEHIIMVRAKCLRVKLHPKPAFL
jgi:acetyl-CoA acetyltransferase